MTGTLRPAHPGFAGHRHGRQQIDALMSVTFAIFRSIVLTVAVGLFLLATGRTARGRGSVLAFCITAALVHLIWWQLPNMDGIAGKAAAWLVSAWVAALVMAVLLILPFALFLGVRRLMLRQPSTRKQTGGLGVSLAYLGIALAVGIAVSFSRVDGPVVREEVVHAKNLPDGLDGLRIANVGDVHIGAFIKPSDLAEAVDIVNARNVEAPIASAANQPH
ncbi:hypothetical protein [Candidatus Nitrotoga arctica]|uniref:Uncharacterized protein n=1 Tax=Candidatus Nitrotoga arctica TaxID=453162 RepID=A0ABM8YZE6_9PROT|nr:hypothetical protein [Candidatus Nitrotoga arctica]CAG9932903.1 membrane protein of unknown function [Candidatus Nitrotoga arctica]